MSMTILESRMSPSANFALRRRFGAGIFAKAVQHNRQARGLSVEEAARLAGMEASEWAAIEAGSVPQTPAELRSIAGTLEIGYDRLLNLVLLCRDAWDL
jgi:transcriptional regulator with XRE-family HTH domain